MISPAGQYSSDISELLSKIQKKWVWFSQNYTRFSIKTEKSATQAARVNGFAHSRWKMKKLATKAARVNGCAQSRLEDEKLANQAACVNGSAHS